MPQYCATFTSAAFAFAFRFIYFCALCLFSQAFSSRHYHLRYPLHFEPRPEAILSAAIIALSKALKYAAVI